MEKTRKKKNASILGCISKKEAKGILLFLAKKAGYERYFVTAHPHPFKQKGLCLMLKNNNFDWACVNEWENVGPGSYNGKFLHVKSKDERDVLEAIAKAAACGHETYVWQSISKTGSSSLGDAAYTVLMHPGQMLEEVLVEMDLDVDR